jgi:hypothetical protein
MKNTWVNPNEKTKITVNHYYWAYDKGLVFPVLARGIFPSTNKEMDGPYTLTFEKVSEEDKTFGKPLGECFSVGCQNVMEKQAATDGEAYKEVSQHLLAEDYRRFAGKENRIVKAVRKVAESKGFRVETQRSFEGCEDVNEMLFDLCISRNNEVQILGEHQGEQHFKFCPMFHENEAEFEKQLRHDEIKRKFATTHFKKIFIVSTYKENEKDIVARYEKAMNDILDEEIGKDVFIQRLDALARKCRVKFEQNRAFCGFEEAFAYCISDEEKIIAVGDYGTNKNEAKAEFAKNTLRVPYLVYEADEPGLRKGTNGYFNAIKNYFRAKEVKLEKSRARREKSLRKRTAANVKRFQSVAKEKALQSLVSDNNEFENLQNDWYEAEPAV